MNPMSVAEVVTAAQGTLVGREAPLRITSISTDSRSIEPNSLFCCLRGANYDGHVFLPEAFQKGAFLGMIDELAWEKPDHLKPLADKYPLIIVKDTYRSLGLIASHYRSKFPIPLLGITGSAGKTTTKECVSTILNFSQNVYSGSGNLNNHIGLPLNLLKMTDQNKIAVLEMGASARNEIEYLCSIADPSMGLITCIHPAHLKGFGSLEGIYQAKLEMADYVGRKKNGVMFVCGDDPKLVSMAKSRCDTVLTFGKMSNCNYRVEGERQEGEYLKFTLNGRHSFRLKGYGLFNAINVSAALAVADRLGSNLDEIAAKWHQLVSVPNRFQIEDLPSPRIRFVKDCYNANPAAFRAALESFAGVPANGGKKIIIAGDMKELGEEAEKYHQELGELLSRQEVDFAILTGEFSGVVGRAIQERNYKIPVMQCSSNREISDFLKSIVSDGDLILLKGSRSMRLEEVVDILRHEFGTQVIS